MNIREIETLRLVRDQAIKISDLTDELESKNEFIKRLLDDNESLRTKGSGKFALEPVPRDVD